MLLLMGCSYWVNSVTGGFSPGITCLYIPSTTCPLTCLLTCRGIFPQWRRRSGLGFCSLHPPVRSILPLPSWLLLIWWGGGSNSLPVYVTTVMVEISIMALMPVLVLVLPTAMAIILATVISACNIFVWQQQYAPLGPCW